ncbi:MAG TPA: hypothetical protein VFJ74_16080 [Gemmatimonadaceae bacterium]|nr:hypothetical protein [Gemmatimonadaceae bacterium]
MPQTPPTPPTPPAPRTPGPSVVPASAIAERKGIVSVLSGNELSGVWSLPRHLRVVAVFGSAKLDLRQARFGAELSELEVFVLAGNVTIVVPPEVRVDSDVDTLAAAVEFRSMAAQDAVGHGPTLRLHGTAIASAVEIEVRAPGDERKYTPGTQKALKRGTRE